MIPRHQKARGKIRGSHPHWVHTCRHPGCTRAVFGLGDVHGRGVAETVPGWTWDGQHLWCLNHGPNAEKH